MAKQTLPTEWKSVKLCDIATPLYENVGERKLETLSISAGVGFVNQAEKFGRELSGKQYENYTVLRRGDFSFNKGNSKRYPYGCIYLLKDREIAAVPNVFYSFRIEGQDSDFFEQMFINGVLNHQLNKVINTGVRNDGLFNLYEGDFYNCAIPLPPLAEQRAIAEILTTADRLIAVKERLIAAKRKQKRWLMSQLLTGKLRLPGFSGAWERVRFSSLFKGHSTISNGSEQYPLYSLTLENGVTPKTERYERSHLVLKGEQYKVVFPNDYVYNPMNITLGAVFRHTESFPVTVSGYYDIFALNDVTEVGFFDNYLTSPTMLRHYDRVATGSVKEKQRVHFSQFIEFNLPLPKAEERQAIAAVLTAADREIQLLTQELEQQRQVKKYLMQQLLTGRIRTKGATV